MRHSAVYLRYQGSFHRGCDTETIPVPQEECVPTLNVDGTVRFVYESDGNRILSQQKIFFSKPVRGVDASHRLCILAAAPEYAIQATTAEMVDSVKCAA